MAGELKQRFELAEINDDARKIKLCQVFIKETEKYILSQFLGDTTWADAKKELIAWLGDGTVEEEVWNSYKQLFRGEKDIVDLRAEVRKFAKEPYLGQQNIAERQVIEDFICALELKLAQELQKSDLRMLDEVIAAAQRIECLQKEYPSPNMDS